MLPSKLAPTIIVSLQREVLCVPAQLSLSLLFAAITPFFLFYSSLSCARGVVCLNHTSTETIETFLVYHPNSPPCRLAPPPKSHSTMSLFGPLPFTTPRFGEFTTKPLDLIPPCWPELGSYVTIVSIGFS